MLALVRVAVRLRRMRVVAAVCCIDARAVELPACLVRAGPAVTGRGRFAATALQAGSVRPTCVLGCIRRRDAACRAIFGAARVVEVDDYPEPVHAGSAFRTATA